MHALAVFETSSIETCALPVLVHVQLLLFIKMKAWVDLAGVQGLTLHPCPIQWLA